jgi:hypothetical protein
MFARYAFRDMALIAIVSLSWHYLAPFTAGEGWWTDLLGVVLGVAVATLCYLGHEWGHLIGAASVGSILGAPEKITAISIFSFDTKQNDRRQFLVMSFSGFVMTGMALLVVYAGLPDGLLATRVARGGVLFLTALTLFIEFPLVIYSLVTSKLPRIEAFDLPAPSHE